MKYSFRWVVTFFILLYLIIAFLFFNFYKNLAIQDARQEAVSILNTMKALRFYTENIQRPLLYDLKTSGKLDKDFFDPRIVSSSYITKHTFDILLKNENINFNYKLAAINPTNPANIASAFEAKVLRQFQNEEIKQYFDIQEENGTEYFYIALPIEKNKPSCLECHGDPDAAPPAMIKQYGSVNGFNENVDDVRAILSLKVPVSRIITYHIKEFALGGLAMLFAFLVFIFFAYLLYKQELTLQSKKEKLLENQNKLASMGEMINNIAHQWRQPLAQISSILVNIELRGRKDKLTKEMIKEKVKDANKQLTFMSETIDDFRNFYLRQQEHKTYHISEAIRHSEQLVSASVYENKIKLIIDIDNDFTLFGCPNDLTQAIINIINNAKDALTENHIENKKIILKTYIVEQKKILSIEDNAGGIPDAIMKKIFEPYYTTKHPSIGTGIGLYMSKNIIEKKHGGTLEVSNTKYGARFMFIF